MFIKLFLSCMLIMVYIHIMIHFSFTKENTLYPLYDPTKETIQNEITYKLPFYFDGSTLPSVLDIKGDYSYEPIDLLEPSVKFFPRHRVYPFKKYIKLHRNLECRNFYKISKGSVICILIHPKYHSLFQKKKQTYVYTKHIREYIRSNPHFIHIALQKGSVLCLPNFWLIALFTNEPSVVEHIQYSTIMNIPALLLG